VPRRAVSSDQAPDALGPYSQAIVAGGLVFCSGMAGIDPATGAVADGIEAQTDQALRNLAAVLSAAGASMDDVVKVTTFYEGDGSGDDLHANLSIRSSYFTEPGPATTGISLPALAYDGMVIEIEVIGMVRED